MNRNGRELRRWGDALREILESAGVPIARVADKVGITAPALFQYLGGRRTPDSRIIHRIDAAVSKLIGEPGIAGYLDAAYWLDALDVETSEGIPIDAWDTFLECIKIAFLYLRPEAKEAIPDRLGELPLPKLRRLALAVNAMWRRRLVAHILGHADPSKSVFEELRDLCVRNGVDLKPWLLPKDELAELVERDDLSRNVRSALLAISNLSDRRKAEQAVMRAFNEFLSSQTRRDLMRLYAEHRKEDR